MRNQFLLAQAEDCRRHAAALNGKPEGPLLLRIAGHFEELALQPTKAEQNKPALTHAESR
jgi:hypothetical protein